MNRSNRALQIANRQVKRPRAEKPPVRAIVERPAGIQSMDRELYAHVREAIRLLKCS